MKSSSNVYHICPIYLRNLRVEVSGGRARRRTRDNAYEGKEEVQGWTYEQRIERYDTLYESIEKDGFNEEFPIVVMLRRENNVDMIFQGSEGLN